MLDPVIHPIPRLRVCAALRSVGAITSSNPAPRDREMRFRELRDAVGASDSALSKQLAALERAGYLRRHRDYGSLRGDDAVWVSLTTEGLRALEKHLVALHEIADAVPPAPGPAGPAPTPAPRPPAPGRPDDAGSASG